MYRTKLDVGREVGSVWYSIENHTAMLDSKALAIASQTTGLPFRKTVITFIILWLVVCFHFCFLQYPKYWLFSLYNYET